MTIGAEGVKVYQNLNHTRIVNTSLSGAWTPIGGLRLDGRISYSYGAESSGRRLPLIAPVTFAGTLHYRFKKLETQFGVRTQAANNHCGKAYGETPTAGYAVWHLGAGYTFHVRKVQTDLRAGIENIFDKHYSTYSDWNHIPQKGRNFYVNISLSL